MVVPMLFIKYDWIPWNFVAQNIGKISGQVDWQPSVHNTKNQSCTESEKLQNTW